jgi:NAD-dependent deacetylase
LAPRRAGHVRCARLLADAKSVVVFTGAGVSAESGVPTYRSGDDGLWSKKNMLRYANPRGYATHFPKSYAFYAARARFLASVQPNAAHVAIARMERLVPHLTVVTQNIDSLHQRAGSTGVIELHGNLRSARCDNCDRRVGWSRAPIDGLCKKCKGMLRPDVVMFDERLPEAPYEEAMQAARTSDVLMSIGTSNTVTPASDVPNAALAASAWLVVVNPDMTNQSAHPKAIHLKGSAAAIVPAVVSSAWPKLKTERRD